jgi:hypothetical protein
MHIGPIIFTEYSNIVSCEWCWTIAIEMRIEKIVELEDLDNSEIRDDYIRCSQF